MSDGIPVGGPLVQPGVSASYRRELRRGGRRRLTEIVSADTVRRMIGNHGGIVVPNPYRASSQPEAGTE